MSETGLPSVNCGLARRHTQPGRLLDRPMGLQQAARSRDGNPRLLVSEVVLPDEGQRLPDVLTTVVTHCSQLHRGLKADGDNMARGGGLGQSVSQIPNCGT